MPTRAIANYTRIMSGWEMVLSGVPQGSVLGPVLFVVFYILMILMRISAARTVPKFADDTKVVATGQGWNRGGQEVLTY